MTHNPDENLWSALYRWLHERYPRRHLIGVRFDLDHGDRVKLPAPGEPGSTAQPAPPFIPNEMQTAIIEALEGKALTTDALAAAAGYGRRTLFRKPGGLEELQAQGLVAHRDGLGYYSPLAPPEELGD